MLQHINPPSLAPTLPHVALDSKIYNQSVLIEWMLECVPGIRYSRTVA